MEAFVLVQTEVGRAELVADRIAAIDGVQTAEYVLGPYDVIVRLAAENNLALATVVRAIQQVAGITRTLKCDLP